MVIPLSEVKPNKSYLIWNVNAPEQKRLIQVMYLHKTNVEFYDHDSRDFLSTDTRNMVAMSLKQTVKAKLIDNPKNREKATVLSALEIALDDSDNPHNVFSDELLAAEAGLHFPWGTEFEITVKVKLPK